MGVKTVTALSTAAVAPPYGKFRRGPRPCSLESGEASTPKQCFGGRTVPPPSPARPPKLPLRENRDVWFKPRQQLIPSLIEADSVGDSQGGVVLIQHGEPGSSPWEPCRFGLISMPRHAGWRRSTRRMAPKRVVFCALPRSMRAAHAQTEETLGQLQAQPDRIDDRNGQIAQEPRRKLVARSGETNHIATVLLDTELTASPSARRSLASRPLPPRSVPARTGRQSER